MKLAILSRNARLHSTMRLVDAARARGHQVRVLDPLRCYMRISAGHFQVHCRGREVLGIEAMIPRIGTSITFYGTALVRQFEMMGVVTPNGSDAILRARDKLRALQLLACAGIDLPTTVIGDNPDDTADLLALLGEPPHVIKLNEGAQGQGVLLAERRAAAQGMVEALRALYANFLVQEFIPEAGGADLRCFVVGERVVAAMRRQAPEGDFRANVHGGGSVAAELPSAAEAALAVRAAQVMGLGIAGVDLLRSARGPLVLEVNSSPGLEGIEQATGVDVADAIVAHVERLLVQARPAPQRETRRH